MPGKRKRTGLERETIEGEIKDLQEEGRAQRDKDNQGERKIPGKEKGTFGKGEGIKQQEY